MTNQHPLLKRRLTTAAMTAYMFLTTMSFSKPIRIRSVAAAAFSTHTIVKSPTRSILRMSSSSTIPTTQENKQPQQQPQPPYKLNLLTTTATELNTLLSSHNFPKYRTTQILHWIQNNHPTSIDSMTNLPLSLRTFLHQHTTLGKLQIASEQISQDGTIKRAYRLHSDSSFEDDNQIIESVLMPYHNRNTACISSQAGCAMGCVFCATGQMGFARQLTSDEIFEQVVRYSMECQAKNERLSRVVFMGMGEPLANYRNVMDATRRIISEIGIGARKITISTVGIVPNIEKLMREKEEVKLAVSLHCADDEERSALLPANKRYGGLDRLMETLKEYTETKKQRITFEWALIEQTNDSPEVARKLGRLIRRHGLRRDFVHVNVIPLNPTGGYGGSPSGKKNVHTFIHVLEEEFGISATPRMRRGIDIDAGCGQLKAKVQKKEKQQPQPLQQERNLDRRPPSSTFEPTLEKEAKRLLDLVQNSSYSSSVVTTKTTSISDETALKDAKRKRKKLLKGLKMIRKLKDWESSGKVLNAEQNEKIGKEQQWKLELESVEHNLK